MKSNQECQQQSCEQACPLELHGSFSIQATSCDLELNQYGEWAKDGGGLRIANVTGGGKLSMKDICELTRIASLLGIGNWIVCWVDLG